MSNDAQFFTPETLQAQPYTIDFGAEGFPKRDWGKQLVFEQPHRDGLVDKNGEPVILRVYTVRAQAHIIGVPMPVGLLSGGRSIDVNAYAMSKSYKTDARYRVVEAYGIGRNHGEPIELGEYIFDVMCDSICHYELNRHRPAHKEWESGRYVDYIKHGLPIVMPYVDNITDEQRRFVIFDAAAGLANYATALIEWGWTKQEARRFLTDRRAIEGVYGLHARGIITTARQRDRKHSPNGKEAEPQIGDIVSQMVDEALPYLQPLQDSVIKAIGEGHR